MENNAPDVRRFIQSSWEKTFRFIPNDEGDLLGLPYRYTVPSVSASFQEMYYWDTYFTNEGLILDGHLEQAINNTENILYLVDLYGRMPNGNRSFFEARSQPPYLSMMVRSIHEVLGDREWLRRVVPVVKREYDFWMTRRLTPCGLNRYSHDGNLAGKERMVAALGRRFGDGFRLAMEKLSRGERARVGSHHMAEAESGWDFTPRFDMRCEDFCPVDLNANLYVYERNFADFARQLGRTKEAAEWLRRAAERKRRIQKFCRDPKTGIYHDYDFVNRTRSRVVSAAVFSLLYAKIPATRDAARLSRLALKKLEYAHGLAACAKATYAHGYQWSFPNLWAPLVFIAVRGLSAYGHEADARRVAEKYRAVVARNFAKTGNLWEKYNARQGDLEVGNEYKLPSMMGWTAGVFVWVDEFLHSPLKR